MEKLIIIDGHNLLFRMFFGLPNAVYDKNGKDIHGVIGFIGSVIKTVKQEAPCHVCIVFDSEIKSERFLDENYKKNRMIGFDEKNGPFSQLEEIIKCLELMQIDWIEKEGVEADDVIASVAKKAEQLVDEIVIISTDKDFFQLINNKIKVLVPRGKLTITYDFKMVLEKFSIIPEKYVEYCALVGDKSDNILGIKGIGKITASKLLNKYDNIENLYNNLMNETKNIQKKLFGQHEKLRYNKRILTLQKDISLEIELKTMYLNNFPYKTMDIIKQVIDIV